MRSEWGRGKEQGHSEIDRAKIMIHIDFHKIIKVSKMNERTFLKDMESSLILGNL